MRVRALSQVIGCDIHPINNLRVLGYLRKNFNADEDAIAAWFRHWVIEASGPLEIMLSQNSPTDRFCHGDAPGMTDICLYAQVLNNQRFAVDVHPYPTIARIFEACAAMPAFADAAPDKQPDAE